MTMRAWRANTAAPIPARMSKMVTLTIVVTGIAVDRCTAVATLFSMYKPPPCAATKWSLAAWTVEFAMIAADSEMWIAPPADSAKPSNSNSEVNMRCSLCRGAADIPDSEAAVLSSRIVVSTDSSAELAAVIAPPYCSAMLRRKTVCETVKDDAGPMTAAPPPPTPAVF